MYLKEGKSFNMQFKFSEKKFTAGSSSFKIFNISLNYKKVFSLSASFFVRFITFL